MRSRLLLFGYLFAASSGLFALLEAGFALGSISPLLPARYWEYPAEPQRFFKIAIVGESSARGSTAERSLRDMLPYELSRLGVTRPVSITVLARDGYPFHRHQAELLKAVLPRFDLVLIYAGNNEYANYLEESGVLRQPKYRHVRQLVPDDEYSPVARRLLLRSRVFAVIQRQFAPRPSSEEVALKREFPRFADAKLLPASALNDIELGFREDLEEIGRLAVRHGVAVIVSSVAVNEDYLPIFSRLNPALDHATADRFLAAYQAGVAAYRQQQWADAKRHLAQAEAIDPQAAEVLHLLGQIARQEKDWDRAFTYFDRAVEQDGFPTRRRPALDDIAREVAVKYPYMSFVDTKAEFRQALRAGIDYDELFSDIVHPNLMGHALLTRTFLHEIRRRSLLPGLGPSTDASLDSRAAYLDLAEHYRVALGVSRSDKVIAWLQRANSDFSTRTLSPNRSSYLRRAAEKFRRADELMAPEDPNRFVTCAALAVIHAEVARSPEAVALLNQLLALSEPALAGTLHGYHIQSLDEVGLRITPQGLALASNRQPASVSETTLPPLPKGCPAK